MEVFVALAVCLVIFLYSYVTWTFDFWKKLKVPYIAPVPIFGNFTFLLRKSPSEFFRETYRQFPNEDYYGIWVFRKPALVIRSPELSRRIMVKDFDSFHDRFLCSGTSDPLGSLNIFTLKEPLWSKVRRRLTPVFTSAKLRNMDGLINFSTRELIDRIRRDHVVGNKPVNLRDIMGCYMTDVIGSAAFGVRCEAVRNDDSPMRRLTRSLGIFNWKRGIEFSSVIFMPSIIDLFKFDMDSKTSTYRTRNAAKLRSVSHGLTKSEQSVYIIGPRIYNAIPAEITDKDMLQSFKTHLKNWLIEKSFYTFKFYPQEMSEHFQEVFCKMATERIKKPTNSKNRDLLDALLELKNLGDPEITDDLVVAQAAIFVLGGVDSVSVIWSYFIYELSHQPEVQERLYEEILVAKEKCRGDSLDTFAISDLPYLTMCIKETLRKYPSMGFLDRIATKDYQIDDKLVLPKGYGVYLNYIGMHYDEKYFPDPLTWDPERFSPENEMNLVPYSYAPFGEGPRSCIGMRFGMIVLKTVISNVILNFKILPKPGQPLPKDVPIEKKAVFQAPEIPLVVQFLERIEK